MNAYLAGTAPELAASNLTDLILGKPKKGGQVVTTIVPALQRGGARGVGQQPGAVAAVDPSTGDVLALWSNPELRPERACVGLGRRPEGRLGSVERRSWTSPCSRKRFQELYLPGSTGKIVTASAALENGVGAGRPVAQPPRARAPADERHPGELRRRALQRRVEDGHHRSGLHLVVQRDVRRDRPGSACRGDGGPGPGVRVLPNLPPEETGCADPLIPFALPFENGRFPQASYFDQNDPLLAIQRDRPGQRVDEPVAPGARSPRRSRTAATCWRRAS